MRDDVVITQDNRAESEDVLTDAETEIENASDGEAATAIGRVAAPYGLEATTNEFYFWIQREHLPENNQFVRTKSTVGGAEIEFYAVIDQLKRGGRRKTVDEEYDVFDGDVSYEPPFKTDGVTFARAQILRSQAEDGQLDIDTPPHEQSLVFLGGEREAQIAYGFEEMSRPMPVGLLKNGASRRAGLGMIDLDYLLGENGGHLNVNGVAGVGTKTTFLLTTIKMLQKAALDSLRTNNKLFIVPIIFNVKGEDLMWLDKPNKRFKPEHEADWQTLGVEPMPFADAKFYEPCDSPVHGCEADKFSWSLQDVLSEESLLFIFSDEDNLSENMIALVREIAADLTEKDGRKLKTGAPQTWQDLIDWMTTTTPNARYGMATWWAVYRRLFKVLDEGKGIFPRDTKTGNPLRVAKTESSPPQVIDISSLPHSLQRFVVGSILKQVVDARKSAKAVANLRYVIMIDELNRFAPKNSKDEVTRLLERVATEMRSQGIILLGAQQMASQVSTKVIEMSSIRVLGRTGAAELGDKVWSSWEKSSRDKAAKLQPSEKLVSQPTFRQPMLVHVPMNPWADKKDNIAAAKIEKDLKKLL